MNEPIDRISKEACGRFVERIYPDAEKRRVCLTLLADSIDAAQRSGANAWNLSIRRDKAGYLQLNIGRYCVLQLLPTRIYIGVDTSQLAEEWRDRLTPALQGESDYRSLSDARFIRVSFDEIPDTARALWTAHARLVERSAASIRQPWVWDNHAGGVTAYMREFLGRDVSDPMSYRPDEAGKGRDLVIPPERLAEMEALYDEFLRDFVPSPAGIKHVGYYERSRESGRRNYEEICAAVDRGEDVTDAVLLKLLPHADTEGNRERGGWIHVAPAITKSTKQLFEGAGWVKPEAWPSVSGSLLAFVRRCIDDPQQLESACAEYAASPYSKGLKMGMVTPILNALRPDDFLLINNKARALIDYLLGMRSGTSLADYPKINRAGFAILDQLEAVLEQPGRPEGLSDADVFDMFLHWLFAIRKFTYGKPVGVVQAESNEEVSSWIFQSNPTLFDLPGALAGLQEMTWVVRQHAKEIRPGDSVYLWESGKDAGIVAHGTVLTEPAEIPEDQESAKFVRSEGAFAGVERRVRIRIDNVFPQRVSRAHLLAHPTLSSLRILGTAQGTNFKVTAEQARLLEKSMPRGETRIWKIAPGENAWQWNECREKGFIAVGWEGLGDISALTQEEFDSMVENAVERNPGDFSKAGAGQLWQFANIKVGDRIVANRGLSQVLGIGTVVGPYAFVVGERHSHRLPVRWDDVTSRRFEAGRAWQYTIRELSSVQFEAISNAPPLDAIDAAKIAVEVELEETEEAAMAEPPAEPRAEYHLTMLAADTGFDEEMLGRWVRAINRKGQAILYGPPGTGKTFVAWKLAEHLAGGGYGLVEVVQFHPAYAYEDFMVGMRPRALPGGGLEYPLVAGRFVEFCDRARRLEGTSVLVVDEINRANLARVFGELMFLLEYRDQTVSLAGGREFSIPENVRVVGTMNTADRSIALVDHALRRRFAFLGLYPNYDVLRKRHSTTGFPVEGLIGVLERLNRAIEDPHYAVGISFFLGANIAETVEDVWRMEIEPYIEEYFFDRRKAFGDFRWEKIRSEILGVEET